MQTKIEYRVRPVTRYIVTRQEFGENHTGRNTQHGEYDNADVAYEVGYALAKAEHDRLGYPPGDERIIYPHPHVGPNERAAEDLIKHMADRFLSWRLPENFTPDAGISFKPTFNEHTDHPMRHEPTGTNLFSHSQAEAMVRHMLEGVS